MQRRRPGRVVPVVASLIAVVLTSAASAAQVAVSAAIDTWELALATGTLTACCACTGTPFTPGGPPSSVVPTTVLEAVGPIALAGTLDTTADTFEYTSVSAAGLSTFSFSGASPIGTYDFTYDPGGPPVTVSTDLTFTYAAEVTFSYPFPTSLLAIDVPSLRTEPAAFATATRLPPAPRLPHGYGRTAR